MTPALNEPIAIGACLVRNRLYRAPVLEGAGDGPDAPEIYSEAFGANARAGVGLIIQGNSCVYPEGRSSAGMTLVDTREHTLRLAPVPAAVHSRILGDSSAEVLCESSNRCVPAQQLGMKARCYNPRVAVKKKARAAH